MKSKIKYYNSDSADELVEKYTEILIQKYSNETSIGLRVLSLKKNVNKLNPFYEFGKFDGIVIFNNDVPVAHGIVVFDKRTPKVAQLGYVEIIDIDKNAKLLFDAVKEISKKNGAVSIYGPINFNTLQEFRYTYESNGRPEYFLEPCSDISDAKMWTNNGLKDVVSYVSTEQPVSESKFNTYAKNEIKAIKNGITFTRLSYNEIDCAIDDLYKITRDAFSDTFAFPEITLNEFKYIYKDTLSKDDLFIIHIAKNETEEIVGYLVSAINIFSEKKKTIVLKSMAVHTKYRKLGIASGLFYQIHKYALENNFDNYIYSTMRVKNTTIRDIVGNAEIIRKYKVGKFDI